MPGWPRVSCHRLIACRSLRSRLSALCPLPSALSLLPLQSTPARFGAVGRGGHLGDGVSGGRPRGVGLRRARGERRWRPAFAQRRRHGPPGGRRLQWAVLRGLRRGRRDHLRALRDEDIAERALSVRGLCDHPPPRSLPLRVRHPLSKHRTLDLRSEPARHAHQTHRGTVTARWCGEERRSERGERRAAEAFRRDDEPGHPCSELNPAVLQQHRPRGPALQPQHNAPAACGQIRSRFSIFLRKKSLQNAYSPQQIEKVSAPTPRRRRRRLLGLLRASRGDRCRAAVGQPRPGGHELAKALARL